jgi:hypothetical protein
MSQPSMQPKQSNTLRNVLFGCLAVFVLVLGVGGFFAYRFIYQPIRNAAANVMELENLTKLNDDIRNRVEFVAPDGNILTQEQVERFMKVQQGMRDNLQGTFTQLEQKYKDIEAKGQGQVQNIREIFGAYSDLFKLVVEAKREQVQQLNEYGFSLPEYQWVKEQVLGAAGLPIAGFDLSQIMNEGAQTVQKVIENVPQQNVDLLAPYKDKLEQYLSFSFFGL